MVPVFWVASDDHDFAEVRSTSVLDDAGQIRTLRYAPEREPVGLPASRVILDETITPAHRRAGPGAARRDAPRQPCSRCCARCYRPGVSLSDAFARLLSALLPDLVVLDASDPALKRADRCP